MPHFLNFSRIYMLPPFPSTETKTDD